MATDGSIVDGPKAWLKRLPSTDRLLQTPAAQALMREHGATLVTAQARELLAQAREQVLAGNLPGWLQAQEPLPALGTMLAQRCTQRLAPRLKRIVNLSGTVIHTNLGRAVLPDAAIEYVSAMMRAPLNLEYDLAAGARGDRDSIVEGLICEITGAQAATVVNNNAAAVLLTLAALARDREVVVSRGEQVEIGGAFRMPDVMASAGARMVEVGTTNRTHLHDYERAITPATTVLMKVHTSNYAVQGFTSAVTEAELAPLARRHGVALVSDLGSGALIDMTRLGLPKEPTPQEMLSAGCDVVTFSGDKLLGGPQAGLIAGRTDLIARIRSFPMKRAMRLSKLPLAALEATLRLYLQPELLTTQLPTLRWLTRPQHVIAQTARTLREPLAQALAPRYSVSEVALISQIGSGSLPVETLPSAGLAIAPVQAGKKGTGTALEALSSALRALPCPIVGRIADDRLLLDCRCLDDASDVLSQLDALQGQLA
ncbi:MAG: L-seryl-tRNA(Sec) selenium transferase [Betaproteobacteria bacterium]|jgi:L-seryl-tRNA(Ser) seleniumtransferase|nr:L-seryl-tRNA(Sec) selenium transferase [Betaproteobacteria bacterium]NBS46683.1 L-seryl-tRNA(Sec) selenium transferase [Betaproteobacteria bacterium]